MTGHSKTGFSKHARIRARRSAIQALYQWQMTELQMSEVIEEFKNERTELKKADKNYFSEILCGLEKNSEDIKLTLEPLLDRPWQEIDPVEQAILQLGIYELKYHPELPWKVVVNESIELCKMFGAEQSYKYVNGVLDRAAHKIRAVEISGSS